jgi:hypothetical protein
MLTLRQLMPMHLYLVVLSLPLPETWELWLMLFCLGVLSLSLRERTGLMR